MPHAQTRLEEAFAFYRATIALIWCGLPSVGYLWLEKHVAVEALRGNAMIVASPQLLPVLGIAGAGTVGFAALGVAYLAWTDPRAGLRAALLHDALLVALLLGSVLLLRDMGAPPAGVRPGSLCSTALLTGAFAAEAVYVARWARLPAVGAAIAACYTASVAWLLW